MSAFPPAVVLAARALGIPALAGVNLYLTVFALGLIKKLTGATVLGPEFGVFASWPVLIVAGVLAVVELVADKVPAVDHVWDAVHTFIRAPGAMVVVAVVMQGQDPAWQVIAVLVGGVAAFAAHSGKATLRLGSTKTTAAAANAVISLGEDALVGFGAWLAAFHPVVLGVLTVAAFALVIIFGPKVLRSVRISAAFSYNYVRYLVHSIREWLDEEWRPEEPPVPLPGAARGTSYNEEPLAVTRVVVGKFGRRRFGWLVLWKDRLTLVVRRAVKDRATTIYFKELDDVYGDEYWTMGQLAFVVRGRTYVVSFFKGREPTAPAAAAMVARARAKP